MCAKAFVSDAESSTTHQVPSVQGTRRRITVLISLTTTSTKQEIRFSSCLEIIVFDFQIPLLRRKSLSNCTQVYVLSSTHRAVHLTITSPRPSQYPRNTLVNISNISSTKSRFFMYIMRGLYVRFEISLDIIRRLLTGNSVPIFVAIPLQHLPSHSKSIFSGPFPPMS